MWLCQCQRYGVVQAHTSKYRKEMVYLLKVSVSELRPEIFDFFGKRAFKSTHQNRTTLILPMPFSDLDTLNPWVGEQ